MPWRYPHSKLPSHFELKYSRDQIMDLFLTFSVIKRALSYCFLCNRTCTTSLKLYEDKVLHLENWQKNGENKEKRLMFMGRLVWASGHPAALSCPHVPWTPSSRGRPMKIQNDKISTFRLRADDGFRNFYGLLVKNRKHSLLASMKLRTIQKFSKPLGDPTSGTST